MSCSQVDESLDPLPLVVDTTNQLFVTGPADKRQLVKRYRGANQSIRLATEKSRLAYWRAAGYPVPKIYENTTPAPRHQLVMEFIDGQDLGAYLRDATVALPEKLEMLKALFQANAKRHSQVLKEQDSELLHHDFNTGNILLDHGRFVFIDFESRMKVPGSVEQLVDMVGIEVAKLIRWSARDIGRAHLGKVIDLMLCAYGSTAVPDSIVRRVHGRKMQSFHRWKDRKKKRQFPDDVSKYDIADTLRSLFKVVG